MPGMALADFQEFSIAVHITGDTTTDRRRRFRIGKETSPPLGGDNRANLAHPKNGKTSLPGSARSKSARASTVKNIPRKIFQLPSLQA